MVRTLMAGCLYEGCGASQLLANLAVSLVKVCISQADFFKTNWGWGRETDSQNIGLQGKVHHIHCTNDTTWKENRLSYRMETVLRFIVDGKRKTSRSKFSMCILLLVSTYECDEFGDLLFVYLSMIVNIWWFTVCLSVNVWWFTVCLSMNVLGVMR